MENRAVGRSVALVAGLGALTVLALTAFCWESLAVQYHLCRLKDEPGYFRQILEKPRGPIPRRAILQFTSTKLGAEALLRATLKEADDLEWHLTEAVSSGHSVLPLYRGGSRDMPVLTRAGLLKAELLRLLSLLRRREFTLPEHRGVQFWVSITDGNSLLGTCVICREKESSSSVR